MNDLDEELLEAVKNNDIETVRVLIESDADVNATDEDDRTLLHYAAMEGHTQMAELLIEKGAIVDALDYWNNRPSDLAVCNGWIDTAGLLEKAQEKDLGLMEIEEKIETPQMETAIIPVVKVGRYSLTEKAFNSSVSILDIQHE